MRREPKKKVQLRKQERRWQRKRHIVQKLKEEL